MKQLLNQSIYFICDKTGLIWSSKSKKYLSGSLNKDGYRITKLRGKNQQTIYNHRIIAENYISNPNSYKEVNHINGIKTDNRIENLEWCTRRYNIIHSFKLGLNKTKTGDESHYAKLTWYDIVRIRYMCRNTPIKKIAQVYRVYPSTIQRIKNYESWV